MFSFFKKLFPAKPIFNRYWFFSYQRKHFNTLDLDFFLHYLQLKWTIQDRFTSFWKYSTAKTKVWNYLFKILLNFRIYAVISTLFQMNNYISINFNRVKSSLWKQWNYFCSYYHCSSQSQSLLHVHSTQRVIQRNEELTYNKDNKSLLDFFHLSLDKIQGLIK